MRLMKYSNPSATITSHRCTPAWRLPQQVRMASSFSLDDLLLHLAFHLILWNAHRPNLLPVRLPARRNGSIEVCKNTRPNSVTFTAVPLEFRV